MKTVLLFALAGALMGVIAASLIVPPALSWYTAPGGLPKGAQGKRWWKSPRSFDTRPRV